MLYLPPRTPLETGLEALSLLGLFAGALLLLAVWPELPAEVPGHYDAAGNVTRYDPKGSLWELVGTSALLYALMSVLNLFPQLWNIGVDRPAEHPKVFRRARTMMRALKAFTVWLFTFILWSTVQVAQGAAAGPPWWFLPLALFAPLVILVSWLYLASRDEATQ